MTTSAPRWGTRTVPRTTIRSLRGQTGRRRGTSGRIRRTVAAYSPGRPRPSTTRPKTPSARLRIRGSTRDVLARNGGDHVLVDRLKRRLQRAAQRAVLGLVRAEERVRRGQRQ